MGSQGMVLVPRMNPQAGVDRGVVGKFQAVLRQGVEQFLDGRDGGCGWGFVDELGAPELLLKKRRERSTDS